jgi:hypothetical protein
MIASGNVYHLLVNAFDPPKHKFLVLAYVSTNGLARFFVINSERTELQKTRDELRKHIISLPQDGSHIFLTHDSWLDCSELIGGWTASELEDQITEEPECAICRLVPKILKAVREVVTNSRLLSERDKQMIIGQWPDLSPPSNA